MSRDVATDTAFNLQIELSTRVATNRLPADQGVLAEALDSLEIILETARKSLVALGTSDQSGKVADLTSDLIDALAPFMAEWRPRLDEHHARRPAGVDSVTHEASWAEAPRLRDELAAVQDALTEILEGLRRMTGCNI